ncbi:MAG TPA: tripartite tricarboxylate transporter substrate binding protein [Burkholderiales bacterium]|nr:tripartite tricarboxylate transporter substrate binding protein [Burkholderiales bacterium]
MRVTPRTRSALAVAACALATAAAPAAAADAVRDYPNHPIRMLVPNAPGSSVDTLGRIFGAALTNVGGQQVVIDNRAGAGGTLGMEIGKNATPDGYTILSASTAAMTIAPHIYTRLPFDPLKDYEFVSLFGVTPNLLVVNPSLPVKSVKELIEYCRGKNGQVNMASAGPGSQSHLAGVVLLSRGNFQALHVPYKGGGASVAAVVAGESQWTVTPAPAVAGLVRSGKLRALGHSLPKRDPLLGDLPPIGESVPGFEYSGWNGLLLPKGTPRPIVDKLRGMLVKATQTPELKKAFEQQLTAVHTNTGPEFRAFVAKELKEMGPVVKAAGLKVE